MQKTQLQLPPDYCQYTTGACDQNFDYVKTFDGFVLYPSEPEIIASTIEEAIKKITSKQTNLKLLSWKDIGITGQIVFCRICQNIRFSNVIIADVSTLNMNVLFEIGYALGLGIPVITIRDVSFITNKRDFAELGLLDTFGYLDFENSEELSNKLLNEIKKAKPPIMQQSVLDQDRPLYLIKSPFTTDGLIKLISGIKKSGLRFRTFDPKETSRLSLHDVYKHVNCSLGVAAHLMSRERIKAKAHNARVAFLCGLAMAGEKHVLMLQEGVDPQPIDYRDVIKTYTNPSDVPKLLGSFIQPLYEVFQSTRFVPITLPLKPLETIDFGDVAAENEINALRYYFVPTAQYHDVRRGHGRLVVGRKGSGKTAIFYGIRNAYWSSQNQIVLDLKPEGHQLTKLRESVLKKLSQGMQEHVLTAFWNYILLMELAHKVINHDEELAKRRPERLTLYQKICDLYGRQPELEQGDFSERLMTLVDSITEKSCNFETISSTSQVTQLIYTTDIKVLRDTLSTYLRNKEGVWILFDNLDKGWPVDGSTSEDILLLRCLLEATRKLQRQLARNEVDFHSVVFIRNDIYEHLLGSTPDKGKDTAVMLEWNDPEVFQQLIHRRIIVSTGYDKPIEQLWTMFFDSHVVGEESFSYILRRTMMRPRDLLRLLRQCVNVAVNRGHNKVLETDILQAEKDYSEDQLQEVSFELRDISQDYPDVLYGFIGSRVVLTQKDIEHIFIDVDIPSENHLKLRDLLLWFGFIGVLNRSNEDIYAYQYHYGVTRMLQDSCDPLSFVIHPAFRAALGCREV